MPYCRHCGEEVHETDEYCGHCGEKWNARTDQQATVPNGTGQPVTASQTAVPSSKPTGLANVLPTKEGNVIPRRIGAVILDSIIAGILLGVLIGLLQLSEGGFVLGYVILYPLYFAVAEAYTSRTPGKAVLDLTVVSASGTRITPKQAVIRNVIRLVDSFIYYLAGFIIILASDRHQRLGDMAANTFVVRESVLEQMDEMH